MKQFLSIYILSSFLCLQPLCAQEPFAKVLGIAQALVDGSITVNEEALTEYIKLGNLKRDDSVNIDKNCADKFYDTMSLDDHFHLSGGGCGANTISGIARLSNSVDDKPAFICAVAKDVLGHFFKKEMRDTGAQIFSKPSELAPQESTGRLFYFVDDKGQRTMAAYPGISSYINEEYIQPDFIKNYGVVFTDGYTLFMKDFIPLIKKAFNIVHANKTRTALSLSSPHLVHNNHAVFMDLLPDVDIIFCNEREAEELTQKRDFDEVTKELCNSFYKDKIIAVTRAEKGACIINNTLIANTKPIIQVKAIEVPKIVDVTGAGDAWAAGFLYGITHELTLKQSGKLGAYCASLVIQKRGARIEKSVHYLMGLVTSSSFIKKMTKDSKSRHLANTH